MLFSEQDTSIIHKLLVDRSVPTKKEYLLKERPNSEAIEKLYDDVLAIRETLGNFAKGNFDIPLTGRGAVWGHLKALQANLKHLTWQVEQVATGDLTQRVDFMGDFSTAFNKMVVQLENSLEEMKKREAAERVQLMFDATPLSCCFWNEQLQLLDCNLEAVKMYGLSGKQEFVERYFDIMPEFQPNGQRSIEIIYEKITETFEKGYAKCEFVHQKFDGESVPTDVSFVRVMQGKEYIVACYSRDLREMKRQQAAVEQQRLLLLDVIKSSPICFAILVDGKVKFSSAFMSRFLRLGTDEPFIGCFIDLEKGTRLLKEVKKGGRIEWEPVTLRSRDHKPKEMLANLFPTNYYGERGMIVWLVDITELKEIEADLHAAKETAERLGRVKDEFIANINHELRTPMNAIFGILHLLRSTNPTEEQESYIYMMETSAKRLLQVINDILDFSNFGSGKVFIRSETFDVRQSLMDVLALLQEVAETKKLSLSHLVDDDVPMKIVGDPMRLQQILGSLADNAVKFTTQGSVEIRVQLESSCDENIVLRFSVKDTGIGMSTVDQKQLFQPFAQADASGTRKYSGVGLGLAVAKNLVEMMGGHIWYDSEPNKGTTFYFTAGFILPKDENENEIVFPESFQGMPVLLVEDNKVNQVVATQILRKKGFHVDVAPDGLRAVEMVKQKDYALVLMDIQMPEMDGIQATQVIRSDEKYKSLPIVALTANALEANRQECLKIGMNDFITKPIRLEVLYRVILKWAKPVTP